MEESKIIKLERYLDAVRSNLLFAKGVILIEGDAEEIIIPFLIKKALGLSLDEMGISLINIGSTGFGNVAQLFHDLRLRRKCSIVTDLDQAVCDTAIIDGDSARDIKYKNSVAASAKSGKERKDILDDFANGNPWIKVCYAKHTFEVDFIQAGNEPECLNTINEIYTDPETRLKAKVELESDDVAVYARRLLRMAKQEGKGWYAILLSGFIDQTTIIPEYIIDAIIFAKQSLSKETIVNIITYRAEYYKKRDEFPMFTDYDEVIAGYLLGHNSFEELIDSVAEVMPSDQILLFLKKI